MKFCGFGAGGKDRRLFDIDRLALDLSPLRQVLTSLSDALEVVGDAAWFNQQSDKVRHTLIAGVIQNFEFMYEISVKNHISGCGF
jgi:hypothetical protein